MRIKKRINLEPKNVVALMPQSSLKTSPRLDNNCEIEQMLITTKPTMAETTALRNACRYLNESSEDPSKLIGDLIASLVRGCDITEPNSMFPIKLHDLEQRSVQDLIKAVIMGFPKYRCMIPENVLREVKLRKKKRNRRLENDAGIISGLLNMSDWRNSDSMAEGKRVEVYDKNLYMLFSTTLAERCFRLSPVYSSLSRDLTRAAEKYAANAYKLLEGGNNDRWRRLNSYLQIAYRIVARRNKALVNIFEEQKMEPVSLETFLIRKFLAGMNIHLDDAKQIAMWLGKSSHLRLVEKT